MDFRKPDKIMAACCSERERARNSAERGKITVDCKLLSKIKELEFFRDEIKSTIDAVCEEMSLLVSKETEIAKTGLEMRELEETAKMCTQLRETLPKDAVDEELMKELKVLERSQSTFDDLSAKLREHQRMFRAMLYSLRVNLRGKEQTIDLERENLSYSKGNADVARTGDLKNLVIGHHGMKNSTQQWQKHTENMISEAFVEMKRALDFRRLVGRSVQDKRESAKVQCESSDAAFIKSIQECEKGKDTLQRHLTETEIEITKMKRMIGDLEKEIADKSPYICLAKSRLQRRENRIQGENVSDQVEMELKNEIVKLQDLVTSLMDKLQLAKESSSSLIKLKVGIEEKISLKMHCMKINKVDCLSLRNTRANI